LAFSGSRANVSTKFCAFSNENDNAALSEFLILQKNVFKSFFYQSLKDKYLALAISSFERPLAEALTTSFRTALTAFLEINLNKIV